MATLIINAREFKDFADEVRAYAPHLTKKVNRRLRDAAGIVAGEAKTRSERQGLESVTPGIKVGVSKGNAVVRSTVSPLGGLMELGSQGNAGVIRHPVFGSPDIDWVDQPTRPYFFGALEAKATEVEESLALALDELLDEIAHI